MLRADGATRRRRLMHRRMRARVGRPLARGSIEDDAVTAEFRALIGKVATGATLSRDEMSKIIGQVTTNWDAGEAKNKSESHLTAAAAAMKGDVSIEADIIAVTRMANGYLERWIRAQPESWLWLHKRWPKALYR